VSRLDPRALRDDAVAIAREAGAILMEGHGREHRPERKGAIDLVTVYDRRSEALILARLRQRHPGSRVLAEESGVHEDEDSGPLRWLVDPLDGTTNYAHNYPFFAVSIAAEVEGVLTAGAIHDPVAGETFAVARGHGATLNERPIRVSATARLEDALLVTGFPYDVRENPEPLMRPFQAFLTRAQAIRRDGAATLNLAYLAMGRFDGFWEARLSPWDLAAGVLLVEEAGGRISDYRGGPFRIEGGEILATNGALHAEMMETLANAGTKSG